MICLDRFRNKGSGTEIPKNLINSIDSIYSSLSALPTDITSMMSLVASLTGGISTLSVNTGVLAGQIYDVSTNAFNSSVLVNYELTSNAFNSSVLTDYAKTSDISGGGGKYQYAFSELPSDANYANLYNITGNVENMTFYSSDLTKTGKNLVMTMAGGYFNSNSIEANNMTSVFINNISSFCNNTDGYIETLRLINCKTFSLNSLKGGFLSLSNCSIMNSNTISFATISLDNVSASYVSGTITCNRLYFSDGRFTSIYFSNLYDANLTGMSFKQVGLIGSESKGNCNISAISNISSFTINDFKKADLRVDISQIAYGTIDGINELKMNCLNSIYNNKISNIFSVDMFALTSITRNTLSNITYANLSGNSLNYNNFTNVGNVNLNLHDISSNKFTSINNNLNITCIGSCMKNSYSSILGDIHLSGNSFNSNNYSSFYGNLFVNCNMFGDYIEHKVSVSNWDFSDLDNNCFNMTVNDYFGNVGGVKNVNISALTFRGNVGAIENLNITAPVMTDQDQMIGLKNVNINCGLCHSLIFLGNTDLNLNITISDSLKDISPEGSMTLDLRYHDTSSPGNIGLYSDYFKYLELKMPESAKKDFTQLFTKDNYHTSSLWKTVSINLLNYIPKSDWMSYNTDLINSNICSWCGMPVSLLA